MQVTMENKKKQWIYIAIIVIAFAATGWLILKNRSGSSQLTDAADVTQNTAQMDEIQSLLPMGPDFDTSVFTNEKYLELNDYTDLKVDPSELGAANPFVFSEEELAEVQTIREQQAQALLEKQNQEQTLEP